MTSSPHGGDDHDAAALITDTEEAANAWMQGDMDRYLALIHHARGFTLTRPNGGPPQQFADRRKEFEGWQSPFSGGEAALEITEDEGPVMPVRPARPLAASGSSGR